MASQWPIRKDERRAVVASIVGTIIDDATDAKTKGALADWLLRADAANFSALPSDDEPEEDEPDQPQETADWRALLNDRPSDEQAEGQAG